MCFWYLHCLPPHRVARSLWIEIFFVKLGVPREHRRHGWCCGEFDWDSGKGMTGHFDCVWAIIKNVINMTWHFWSLHQWWIIIAVNDIVCTQVAIPVAQGVLESVPTLVSQGSRWGLEQPEFLAENLTLRQFEFWGRFHCYPLDYQFCTSSNDSVPISFQYVLYELSHICIVQRFLNHLFL